MRRKAYGDRWEELAAENAPLRAVVNGCLMGVPQDFYDVALRANLPEGEVRVAQVIGRTLGRIPGVGDRWLFLRMQAMLDSGELVSVAAAKDHPYSAVVKKR